MENFNIVSMPISSIKPYENNPRHNERAIDDVATSIRRYGFQQPIVVDKDGVIVVGHTRYHAAKLLGYTHVPVHISQLSDEQNREYRIVDNKTNEAASWDFAKLDAEIIDLDFSDFNFNLGFSFTGGDIDSLFTDKEDEAEDNDDTKEASENTAEIECPYCHRTFTA